MTDRAEQMRAAAADQAKAFTDKSLVLRVNRRDGSEVKRFDADQVMREMRAVAAAIEADIRALPLPPAPPLADDVAKHIARTRKVIAATEAQYIQHGTQPPLTVKAAQSLEWIERLARELAEATERAEYTEGTNLVLIGDNDRLKARAEKAEAEVARLARELADAEAAIDSIETSHGLTDRGNLWRWWREKCREFWAQRTEANARANAAEAEVARMGRELNRARYGEPDFAWSLHLNKMADLEADNARLRDALEEVRLAFHNVDSQVSDEGEFTERAWEQLRAALTPKGAGHE